MLLCVKRAQQRKRLFYVQHVQGHDLLLLLSSHQEALLICSASASVCLLSELLV